MDSSHAKFGNLVPERRPGIRKSGLAVVRVMARTDAIHIPRWKPPWGLCYLNGRRRIRRHRDDELVDYRKGRTIKALALKVRVSCMVIIVDVDPTLTNHASIMVRGASGTHGQCLTHLRSTRDGL